MNGQTGGPSSFVQRDEKSGETYLRLPMPSPELLDQVLRGGRQAKQQERNEVPHAVG